MNKIREIEQVFRARFPGDDGDSGDFQTQIPSHFIQFAQNIDLCVCDADSQMSVPHKTQW